CARTSYWLAHQAPGATPGLRGEQVPRFASDRRCSSLRRPSDIFFQSKLNQRGERSALALRLLFGPLDELPVDPDRDRLFPRQGLGLLNGQAETLQFLYGASAEIRDGQAAALPPGYCLSYRLLPRFTPSIDPDNVVPVLPAPDLVSCVFTHQSVPPARWCLGR